MSEAEVKSVDLLPATITKGSGDVPNIEWQAEARNIPESPRSS